LDFPMRSALLSSADGHGTSRFPCEAFPSVRGVSGRARSRPVSRWRPNRCGLPLPA